MAERAARRRAASWSPAARASSARTSCAMALRALARRARRGARCAHLRRATARTSTACPTPRAHVRARRHPRSGGGGARRWTGCDVRASTSPPSRTSTARSRRRASSSRPTSTACSCCCEEARRRGVERFVQISTDEVYGEVLEGHVDRGRRPLDAAQPVRREQGGRRPARLRLLRARTGCRSSITRCSNNYGPYQYPEKLIPLFVTNALDDEPLPVYGTGHEPARLDPRRRPLRRARRRCSRHPGVEGETFNIGARPRARRAHDHRHASSSCSASRRTLIRHVEDRPGHDRRYARRLVEARRARPAGSRGSRSRTGIAADGRVVRGSGATGGGRSRPGEFRAYYERMYGKRKVLAVGGSTTAEKP